jgi:phenylpropionate dioxygenase-like ring-hydroxylating dioxygenase large terminal subunit
MLTADQSHRLTRIAGGAPMGRLLASFWQPVCRAAAVRPGEPLALVRLGMRLLIRRDDASGTVEASLAGGRMLPAIEAGDIVWTFPGEGAPPPFPRFESTQVPPSHRDVRCAITKANWLQTLEAVLDTAHLGFLHRSSILAAAGAATFRNLSALFADTAPRIEVERTGYGLREAALRSLPDGRVNTRIREFVGPNHALIPSEPDAERQHIVTVPIDDTATIQFITTYNPFRPVTPAEIDTIWFDTLPDRDDIMNGAAGEDVLWNQDREAMRAGHFSGLTQRQSLYEDLAICESMGPIVDHAGEHLTAGDVTIAAVRRELLRALDRLAANEPGWREAQAGIAFDHMRSHVATLLPQDDWRACSPFFRAPAGDAEPTNDSLSPIT